jgi:hypothetical protein
MLTYLRPLPGTLWPGRWDEMGMIRGPSFFNEQEYRNNKFLSFDLPKNKTYLFQYITVLAQISLFVL